MKGIFSIPPDGHDDLLAVLVGDGCFADRIAFIRGRRPLGPALTRAQVNALPGDGEPAVFARELGVYVAVLFIRARGLCAVVQLVITVFLSFVVIPELVGVHRGHAAGAVEIQIELGVSGDTIFGPGIRNSVVSTIFGPMTWRRRPGWSPPQRRHCHRSECPRGRSACRP